MGGLTVDMPLMACPEGGRIGTAQLDWFRAAADKDVVRKPPAESLIRLGVMWPRLPDKPLLTD